MAVFVFDMTNILIETTNSVAIKPLIRNVREIFLVVVASLHTKYFSLCPSNTRYHSTARDHIGVPKQCRKRRLCWCAKFIFKENSFVVQPLALNCFQ